MILTHTIDRSVRRVLHMGLAPEESTGKLRGYFEHLRRFERADSVIRIYGNHVYVFDGDVLVTVLGLPDEYRGCLQDAMTQRICAAGA